MNFCQYCGKPLQPVKAETSAADAAPGGKAAAEEETAAQREAVSNKSEEAAAPTGEGGAAETPAPAKKTAAGKSRFSYHVDLVFCIDATESMDNILDIVKDNALNLYGDIVALMQENKKRIDTLRVRVVAFRDYMADGDEAMLETRFFDLPDEAEAFKECVRSIEAKGGGDDPEDGLEALAFAICSDWDRSGMKRRHVIALWSDAPTHPLGYGRERKNYPQNMAADLKELTSWWGSLGSGKDAIMDPYAKRLILFTPEVESWNSIANHWEQVYRVPTLEGNGSSEHRYESILNAIIHTI